MYHSVSRAQDENEEKDWRDRSVSPLRRHVTSLRVESRSRSEARKVLHTHSKLFSKPDEIPLEPAYRHEGVSVDSAAAALRLEREAMRLRSLEKRHGGITGRSKSETP